MSRANMARAMSPGEAPEFGVPREIGGGFLGEPLDLDVPRAEHTA